MKIARIERNINYVLIDESGDDHGYTLSNSGPTDDGTKPTTCIFFGSSEMELPTEEIPFLIEALQMFVNDDKKINE